MRAEPDTPEPKAPLDLAHRTSNGLEVVLLWDGSDGLRLLVSDACTGESFELAGLDGRTAMDAFHHPFAYADALGIELGAADRPDRAAA
jgi:hypothetical protein